MTPSTSTATPSRASVTSSDAPVDGPMGRIVAAALALGVASAIGFVVLLPGTPEPILVGGVLLAFAAGWAVIAVLSLRLTNRGQPWALVPAGMLALFGSALIIARPDEPLMSRAAWLWGPTLIGVALFVGTRASGLPWRGRALVYPVAFVTALAGVGGLAHVATSQPVPSAMPGELVDVGGYRLHLSCAGSGSPTVILLNGLGETSPLWAAIQAGTAATSRVCAYDRAGQGWSDDSTNSADATTAATDLHQLLAAAGERGPFILTGHSTGGVHALRYAAQYPDDIAGLVLLDSSSPHQAALVPSFPGEYQVMRRGLAIAPTLMRLGVGDALSWVAADSDDPAARFANSPRELLNMRAEQALLPTTFEQAQALTSLGSRPLVVVTAKQNADSNPGWATAQDGLTHLSTNVRHPTVDVDHAGLLNTSVGAGASISAIADAVRSAATDQPLPNP